MSEMRIAIAGGGPAGLVLGLLLARGGFSVTVLEQSASFAREYRGEGVTPGTMRLFDDLGLGAEMRALDRGSPTRVEAVVDGRAIDFPLNDLLRGRPATSFLPQPAMLGILAQALHATGRGIVALETRVKGLHHHGDRVDGVIVSDARGERTLSADLVAGCDGRFSRLRTAARIGTRGTRVPFDVLWLKVAPSTPPGTVYVRAAGSELCFAFPSRGAVAQVGWLVAKGEAARLRERPFEDAKATLVSRAPEALREAIALRLRTFSDLALLPVVSESARRWHVPGLLLLGDAAHPMSPVAAQGINVAVADAVVAARYLVPARSREGLDAGAAAFERYRRPAVARIAAQQHLIVRLMSLLGPARALRAGFAAQRALARLPWEPAPLRDAIDRFAWGDPPVRVAEDSEPSAL